MSGFLVARKIQDDKRGVALGNPAVMARTYLRDSPTISSALCSCLTRLTPSYVHFYLAFFQ